MKNNRIYKGDTAVIEASLFDLDDTTPLPAKEVSWQIKKPNGDVTSFGPVNLDETFISIAFNDTALPGPYSGQITFTLYDNTKRSSVQKFEVIDPLEVTGEANTPVDKIVDRAWLKLEDLFDAELGGPHVRDRTLVGFDREKMKRFLPDALYNINNYYQPASGFAEENFPYETHGPLLSQGLLLETMYHLVRSYVEQPVPAGGATPGYFDRRDYMNRWQAVLTAEETRFNVWLDLFKRDQMNFGSSSILVGGYANYTSRYPRYMRGRFPYMYRW